MPISRHRKLTHRELIKHTKRRYTIMERNRPRVMEIYDKGMPKFQEYPPTLLNDIRALGNHSAKYKSEPSRVERFIPHSEMKAGQIITRGKQDYEVQRSGALRKVLVT